MFVYEIMQWSPFYEASQDAAVLRKAAYDDLRSLLDDPCLLVSCCARSLYDTYIHVLPMIVNWLVAVAAMQVEMKLGK